MDLAGENGKTRTFKTSIGPYLTFVHQILEYQSVPELIKIECLKIYVDLTLYTFQKSYFFT